MLKIFLIVAGIILVGFLIMDDSYNFSIQTMGYEYSFSIALLIIGLIAFFYALHFIKAPISWIKNYRNRQFQKNILKKENFLAYVSEVELYFDEELEDYDGIVTYNAPHSNYLMDEDIFIPSIMCSDSTDEYESYDYNTFSDYWLDDIGVEFYCEIDFDKLYSY